MSKKFADRLRGLLDEFGETPQSLGHALGWSLAKVDRILDGTKAIDLYDLHRLAVFFNRSPSWIYYGDEPVSITQREQFKTLDNIWASAIEQESPEEAEKAAFHDLLEGVGKRRTSKAIPRDVVDDTLRYWVGKGQHPFRHFYEE